MDNPVNLPACNTGTVVANFQTINLYASMLYRQAIDYA